jgi:hypothetical protein
MDRKSRLNTGTVIQNTLNTHPNTPSTTIPNIVNITPIAMLEEVDSLPPFQREQAESHYKGMYVKWELSLSSILSTKDNIASTSFIFNNSIPRVYVDIDTEKCPLIKIDRKGKKYEIVGKIINFKFSNVDLELVSLTEVEPRRN